MRYKTAAGNDPKAGEWDFRGQCAPNEDGTNWYSGMETFSLGVFRWEATADGRNVKRGRVVKRFSGRRGTERETYAAARNEVVTRNVLGI